MIEFDVEMCRTQAVKAVKCIVFFRRLAKEANHDKLELAEMERNFREAASELMRVEKVMQAEAKWPKDRTF